MLKTLLAYVFVAFLFIGCAVQGRPEGGPKDQEPPKVIDLMPDSFQTNYRGRRIIVTFDEFVNLRSARENILFSPPLKYDPKASLKGKSLHIVIQDTLLENTTYKVQIGGAIADLHEGNVLEDYQIIFSTGNKIDSIEISGNVLDAYTKLPAEDIMVSLYSDSADSVFSTKRPFYFAYPDENGNFTLDYLKEGTYQLFTLNDLNRNYYFDQGEAAGFRNEQIDLEKDTTVEELLISTPFPEKAEVLKIEEPLLFQYQLIFNRIIDLDEIKALNKNDSLFVIGKGILDTLTIFKKLKDDSLLLKLDYLNTTDTVKLFPQRGELSNDSIFMLRQNFKASNLRQNQSFSYKSKYPITDILTPDSITIMRDTSLKIKDYVIRIDSLDPRILWLDFNKEAGKIYNVNLPKGLCRNMSGQKSLPKNLTATAKGNENYGTFEGKIVNKDSVSVLPSGQIILQLLDSDKKLKREIILDQELKFNFEWLTAGDYFLKLIWDQNSNGYWDPVDLIDNKQAEPVYIHPNAFSIKENWDLTGSLIIPDFL